MVPPPPPSPVIQFTLKKCIHVYPHPSLPVNTVYIKKCIHVYLYKGTNFMHACMRVCILCVHAHAHAHRSLCIVVRVCLCVHACVHYYFHYYFYQHGINKDFFFFFFLNITFSNLPLQKLKRKIILSQMAIYIFYFFTSMLFHTWNEWLMLRQKQRLHADVQFTPLTLTPSKTTNCKIIKSSCHCG